jgi:hypothetical protein
VIGQKRRKAMRRHFDRRRAVSARPWTAAERRVVFRGWCGRLAIAIEPLIIAIFFGAMTIALFVRGQDSAKFVGPIFGTGSLAFLAYAIVLMVPSTRALIESFGSIYRVDGYVRYRAARRYEDEAPSYFVAVLDASEHELGEWPLGGRPGAMDAADKWPALVEFTGIGGVLRIDGRSTGVLPDSITPFGVGMNRTARGDAAAEAAAAGEAPA